MRAMKKLLSIMCLSIVLTLGMPIIMPFTDVITAVEAATKVKLNKTKATIYVGKSVQLKIKGTKSKVKWTSNKKSVAKVSSNGKVTGKKAGKAVITAKVGKKKYKCNITVKTNKKDSKLSMLKQITINVGEGAKLTVKGTSKKINWSVDNKKIVSVKDGIIKGLRNGKAVVSAKVDGQVLRCSVTVNLVVESIVLDKTRETMILEKLNSEWERSREYCLGTNNNLDRNNAKNTTIGSKTIFYNKRSDKAANLRATVTVMGSPTDQTIQWTSNNPKVATVDQNGGITAVGVGTCTITASYLNKSADCLIVVKGFDDLVTVNITKPETDTYIHTIHFFNYDDYVDIGNQQVTFKVSYSYEYETIASGHVGIQPIIIYEVLDIIDFGSNKYYNARVDGDIGKEFPSSGGPCVYYNNDNIYMEKLQVFGFFDYKLSYFLQHEGNGQLKIGDKITFRALEYYKVDLDKKAIVNLNFAE